MYRLNTAAECRASRERIEAVADLREASANDGSRSKTASISQGYGDEDMSAMARLIRKHSGLA